MADRLRSLDGAESDDEISFIRPPTRTSQKFSSSDCDKTVTGKGPFNHSEVETSDVMAWEHTT